MKPILFALWLALTFGLLAQTFDVASIKPSQLSRAGGEGSGRERVVVTPTGVVLTNATLAFGIQWAHGVRFDRIAGAQLSPERYDIVAKAERPVTAEQLRRMMQSLLADRFGLRLHRELRPLPVFELFAGNSGARLKHSAPGQRTEMSVANGSFVFRHVTMAEFAERLSDLSAFDRPVLDKTGIEGTFDIELEGAARAMLDDPSSIFSAMEKIGFILTPHKSPVEVLVIDRTQKPTPND